MALFIFLLRTSHHFSSISGNNACPVFRVDASPTLILSQNQALLLSLSSHLKFLVESTSGKSCGCVEDVPTLFLPDWNHNVIESLIILLYSGSVNVTGDIMEELPRLMHELRFDISPDQLIAKPTADTTNHSTYRDSQVSIEDHSTYSDSPVPIEEALVDENQMATISTNKLEKAFYDSAAQKKGWIHNIETERVNKEQEMVIKKLREAIDFIDQFHIQNKYFFYTIRAGLDCLITSLKYLPTNPTFDLLPMEIKSHIFSYLCDNGSFVAASVCLEWKEIFKKRLQREAYGSNMLTEIEIGRHCSSLYSCEDGRCFMPEEILKASLILNLDIRLKICHFVTNVDSELLAKALTSVSEFSISEYCSCVPYQWNLGFEGNLTQNQMKVLFETIDQNNETLKSVQLNDINMIHVDQDWLMKCLLKVNRLLLSEYPHGYPYKWLEVKSLRENLLHSTSASRISELYLDLFLYDSFHNEEDWAIDLADALCRVETVYLGCEALLHSLTINQLVVNILEQRGMMKNFFIFCPIAWRDLASIEILKDMLDKLKSFLFFGDFTVEQLDVVRSIPNVYVEPGEHIPGNDNELGIRIETVIRKGIYVDRSRIASKDFHLIECFFRK